MNHRRMNKKLELKDIIPVYYVRHSNFINDHK